MTPRDGTGYNLPDVHRFRADGDGQGRPFAGEMSIHTTFYHTLVSGYRRGLWSALGRGGLWAACIPYGWITRLRNAVYDRGWKRSRRAAVPVVSVGNLTLGGTGKTPCVEYVARYYQSLGRRVALLSRGYGGTDGGNDEARVLADNLPDVPHLQGADRVSLAQRAVAEYDSEVLVLDDGFQHRRLHRDLDLVLVDATLPWGHGHLFPRGLLRERPEGLGRAGIVLLTRCDLVSADERERLRQRIQALAGRVPVLETVHRPVEWVNARGKTAPLAMAVGQPAAAFCGVGNPEAFLRTLSSLKVAVRDFRTYPDHYAYSTADLNELDARAARQPAALVVTTQKDLVKIPRDRLGGRPLWALRVALVVKTGEELLHRELARVVRDRLATPR